MNVARKRMLLLRSKNPATLPTYSLLQRNLTQLWLLSWASKLLAILLHGPTLVTRA